MRWRHDTVFVGLFFCGILVHAPATVRADFGDYVDPTFNCPATTTCPMICVANVSNCPSSCETGLVLCKDGNCETECDDGDDALESPCKASCASVACAKVVALSTDCEEDFGPYYEAAEICADEESTAKLLSFNDSGYLVAYVWYSFLTACILTWCAVNQRVGAAPAVKVDFVGHPSCWQTGYRWTPIGFALYVLTVSSFLGWLGLLAFLTIQYYVFDGSEHLSNRTIHFTDEIQLLKTFIITWSVGFTWSFALKWPYSIQSLFLKRCSLELATRVAVFQENSDPPTSPANDKALPNFFILNHIMPIFSSAYASINKSMAFIFSDKECWHCRAGTFRYARVVITTDGTRFMNFATLRHNFDDVTQTFIPASWPVGTRLGDFYENHEGLTDKEASARFD